MNQALHDFIHLLFIGFVALFPVVNPIGTAFVVMPYFAHLDDAGKRRAVRKIALYAFCVCIVALLAGQWILKLFGLSVPVVQVAGGIMICKIGWEFLSSDKDDDDGTDKDDDDAEGPKGTAWCRRCVLYAGDDDGCVRRWDLRPTLYRLGITPISRSST